MLSDGLTADRKVHSCFLVQDSSTAVFMYDGVVVDMENINSVMY